jgi:hypothetical protein
MAIAYVPPGVTTVTETRTSPILPPGGGITLPALVGEAQGFETFTESVVLTGTSDSSLVKTGAVLDGDNDVKSVTKTTTRESVRNTNYILTQTSPSNGIIDGDTVTTIKRINYPAAPTLTATSGALTGQYRYAIAWYFGDDVNGNPIESGIDEANVATISLTSQSVNLSAIQISNPPTTAAGAATGRVVYRSKNLGTVSNPDWGPWYMIETIEDLSTTTATDNLSDTDAAARDRASIGINSGEAVFVQYDFADETYYEPTLFEDLQDVFEKYGASTDSSGNIYSELSFGAHLAFLNGASQLVCVALPASHTSADIANALEKLEDEIDIRIVVVLDGSATAVSSVVAHVVAANGKKLLRTAIVGRDGVSETVSVQGLRDNASAIQNEAVQMVSPAIVQYRNGFENRNVNIGSHYAAAAFAGMYAARLPQETLTKKSVAGLIGLGEKRTNNAKDVDAAAGLTVLEDRGGILRIRDSISTDRTSINTQQFAVTLAKHNMLADVINAMDELVAGQIIADDLASIHIVSIASSVLDRKRQLGIIYGYQGLRARPVSGDPTTYNVDWQYKPSYTINNITISFSINLDTGSTQLTGAGLGGSTGLIL